MAVTPLPTPADSRLAFLCRCGTTRLCAITFDEAGGNLPKDEGEDSWHLLRSFALGVQEPIPASVNPENVLAGIELRGFYLWYDMSVSIAKHTPR